jgi:hypothetical protein
VKRFEDAAVVELVATQFLRAAHDEQFAIIVSLRLIRFGGHLPKGGYDGRECRRLSAHRVEHLHAAGVV